MLVVRITSNFIIWNESAVALLGYWLWRFWVDHIRRRNDRDLRDTNVWYWGEPVPPIFVSFGYFPDKLYYDYTASANISGTGTGNTHNQDRNLVFCKLLFLIRIRLDSDNSAGSWTKSCGFWVGSAIILTATTRQFITLMLSSQTHITKHTMKIIV